MLPLAQIVIWLIVFFFASNLSIGLNPYSKQMHTMRAMSVLVILFIIYYNSTKISIATMVLLPLSVDKITYYHEIPSESKTISIAN
jgi:hypothetical protein